MWSPAKRESSPASPEIIPKKPLVLTWGHDLTGEFYSPSLITKPALLERFVVGKKRETFYFLHIISWMFLFKRGWHVVIAQFLT